MNYSTSVLLINKNIRAVQGKYEENGGTVVFKTLDKTLKAGDFAAVESVTRWQVTTVKVTAVDVDVDFDSTTKMLWVVQKIDMEAHEKVIAMENQAIDVMKAGELRKRREDIRSNILDAEAAGEIDKLDIAKLGTAQITDATTS